MSRYVIKAVLSNPTHPEFGQVTIPFPIPDSEYAHTIETLSAIGIGSAAARDCRVDEIDSWYQLLNRLEGSTQTVNVDELDYLAKRLDSFDVGEGEQYAAMLYKGGYWKIEDLINLTFCCQQATVVSDFSDLERIGRSHAMHLNGGAMLQEALDKLDARFEALKLIQSGEGIVTPHGVVYDNGMKLEQLYQGKSFPGYLYERSEVVLSVTPKDAPDGADPTFIYLPALQSQIDRALQRGGIDDLSTAHIEVDCDFLPLEAGEALHLENESIEALNEMCRAVARLSDNDKRKLNAVVVLAEPRSAQQLQSLAEDIELFDYVPGVQTPEELGEYMVKESGHFEYDPNLEGFYDYEKLGRQRMAEHDGQFTVHGYVSYEGSQPLQKLMEGGSAFQMGGMQT